MAEQKQDAVRVDWRKSVSWLALFRGFRIALDVKKMVLGFVALVATYGAFVILVAIWNAVGQSPPGDDKLPSLAREAIGVIGEVPRAVLTGRFDPLLSAAVGLGSDVRELVAKHTGFSIAFGIVLLLIWSYFGGAISRMAAVQFARDGERMSLTEALTFTGKRYISFVFAPVIPLLAIILVCVFTGAVGLLAWIPGFGEWFAGLLWPLPLVAGFILALVAVGGSFGLPLMHPTIAAEGTDAFDAISRSFSYIYSRPWRAAFYAVLSVIYGVIVFVFVALFANLLLYFSKFCVTFWSGQIFPGGLGDKIGKMWPSISVHNWQPWSGTAAGWNQLTTSEKGAAFFLGFWVWLILGLVWGYAVSYGYSALTIIYFLLRKDVDRTDFGEVYLEEEEEEFEELEEKAEEVPKEEGAREESAGPEEPREGGQGGEGGSAEEKRGETDNA